MNETIFLVFDRYGIKKMTKNLPSLGRGEQFIKLEVDIAEEAMKPPILTQKIEITDWRGGVAFNDISLGQMVITEEEAELLRKQRLEMAIKDLENMGFEVKPKE